MSIVANIFSLVHHLKLLWENPEHYRIAYCPHCGKAGLWFHGSYSRKADRESTCRDSLNPVPIPRFFCPSCERTCSALPECIPRKRWYLWKIQEAALLAVLLGKSFSAVARELSPSRQTVSRWMGRFKAQFRHHKDALCNLFFDLGYAVEFGDFWRTFLETHPLSTGMRLCQISGVVIP